MKNTKKLIYSLYAAGTVLGASMLSGCQTQYVYPEGAPIAQPAASPSFSSSSNVFGSIISGILQGIGQGLSAL